MARLSADPSNSASPPVLRGHFLTDPPSGPIEEFHVQSAALPQRRVLDAPLTRIPLLRPLRHVLAEVPVGVEPEGMAVSPDNKYTAATSESTSMAHIIENASQQLVANVLVDSRPREAKWTKDGKELWVASEIGGTVSVIDPTTWEITKKISFEVPGVRPEQLQPVGMDFVNDGERETSVACRPLQTVSRDSMRPRRNSPARLNSSTPAPALLPTRTPCSSNRFGIVAHGLPIPGGV